jgi:hypothetical protein
VFGAPGRISERNNFEKGSLIMTASREDLHQAWLTHRRAHGPKSAYETVRRVAGTHNLDDVPEDRREEVITALGGGAPSGAGATLTAVAAVAWAKWNGGAS